MLSRSTTRLSLAPIMVWPVTKFGDVPSFNLNMGRDEWRRHARHVFGCEYLVSNWFVSRCYCCSCCCCHRHVAAVILSCFCLLLHSNSNTVDVMLLSFCCFHADVILLLPWCWCHTAADILLLPFCYCHSAFAMLQLPCLSFCCFHTVVIDVTLWCVMFLFFTLNLSAWPSSFQGTRSSKMATHFVSAYRIQKCVAQINNTGFIDTYERTQNFFQDSDAFARHAGRGWQCNVWHYVAARLTNWRFWSCVWGAREVCVDVWWWW